MASRERKMEFGEEITWSRWELSGNRSRTPVAAAGEWEPRSVEAASVEPQTEPGNERLPDPCHRSQASGARRCGRIHRVHPIPPTAGIRGMSSEPRPPAPSGRSAPQPTPRGGLRSWLGGCAFLGHGERSRRSLRSDKTRAPLSISRCSWNWRLGDGIRAPTVRRSALVELPGTRAVARSNSSGPRSEPGALLALDRSVARRGGERLIMGARVQGPNDLVRVEKRQAACG